MTAVGNTVAPFVAACCYRAGFRRQLDRQDAIAFVFLAALGACSSAPRSERVTLVVAGSITTAELPAAWAVWWTGDAMGVLAVAPFLLCLPLSGSCAAGRCGGGSRP